MIFVFVGFGGAGDDRAWFSLKVVFGHWACGKQACLVADLTMDFVDDWVMRLLLAE